MKYSFSFQLRMTRAGMSSKSTYPKSIFFTFKFYRFPETTTSRFEQVYLSLQIFIVEYMYRVLLERMHDNISNDPNVEPYVLWRLKEDSTRTSGLPGLPVRTKIFFSQIILLIHTG
jgi:hypothetical protein